MLGALVSKSLVDAPAEDVGPSSAMTAPFSAVIPVGATSLLRHYGRCAFRVTTMDAYHQVTAEADGRYHIQPDPTEAVSHAAGQRRGAVAGTSRQSSAYSRRAMAPDQVLKDMRGWQAMTRAPGRSGPLAERVGSFLQAARPQDRRQ